MSHSVESPSRSKRSRSSSKDSEKPRSSSRHKQMPDEREKTTLVGEDTYKRIKKELKDLKSKATTAAEQEYLEEYLRLFVTNRRIIRLFEKKLLENPMSRDVYALMTLYSQQREIINDIRMISDLGGQVELIHSHVLRPYTSSLIQSVTDSYYQLRTLISQTCKKDTQFALEQLAELVKQLSISINTGQSVAIEELNRIMLGGGAPEKPKRKKR